MLKHEGFATAQKVKLSFLGVGVMEDAVLKVFKEQNEDFKKWSLRKTLPKHL
jgi:predicted DNA-binding protein with PD1-like motif